MRLYSYPGKKRWPEIIQRPVADNASLEKIVKKILQKVKLKGDKAVRRYTKEFDGVKLKNFIVSEKVIAAAESLVSDNLKQAMQQAKKNMTPSRVQSPQAFPDQTKPDHVATTCRRHIRLVS